MEEQRRLIFDMLFTLNQSKEVHERLRRDRRERAERINRERRSRARYEEKTSPRGTVIPDVRYYMKAQVADSLDLDRITFGERYDSGVTFCNEKLKTFVIFLDNGWVTAVGPHAFALLSTAILFLARTKIAPNASLDSIQTFMTKVSGRGRNANL